MSNRKKAQTAPAVATHDPPNDKTAKSRAEEMFGGVTQPTEVLNDPPTMHVDVVLDLPEHADPDGGTTAKDAKDALDGFINAFGTDKLPQTQFPVPKSRNNGVAAANFAMWDHVNRRVQKAFKDAADEAEKQGVFGSADSYVEGETTMTFNSAEFAISVKKNAGSKVIDKDLVETVLREVAPGRWQELLDRCFKPRAGAAMRIVSLK